MRRKNYNIGITDGLSDQGTRLLEFHMLNAIVRYGTKSPRPSWFTGVSEMTIIIRDSGTLFSLV